MSKQSAKIVVVGSINMDLVAQCPSLPLAGQTVQAVDVQENFGGKGANQAIAAARAGGSVQMVGRVGDDAFAKKLLDNLRHESVDVSAVDCTDGSASGLAMIAVDEAGENQIIVVAGANGLISAKDVQRCTSAIEQCDVLLLQLEVPLDVVSAAIATATNSRCRVVLDPAPVPKNGLKSELFQMDKFNVDLICPNETEATMLTGMPADSMDELKAIAKVLSERGAANVAITLGARGTLLYSEGLVTLIDAFTIDPVDTTGAGDAFAGALSVRWVETGDLKDAIRFANAAGGLAATQPGASQSMPNREDIDVAVIRSE